MKSLTQTGRYLSLLLRHKPEKAGLTLDRHGWADATALIEGVRRTHPDFNRRVLEEIVRTDKKQRYSFSEDGTKIRANQGHSIPVDVGLERLDPPESLWHGTAEKYLASIQKEGLKPGNRLYVHLSNDGQGGQPPWQTGCVPGSYGRNGGLPVFPLGERGVADRARARAIPGIMYRSTGKRLNHSARPHICPNINSLKFKEGLFQHHDSPFFIVFTIYFQCRNRRCAGISCR